MTLLIPLVIFGAIFWGIASLMGRRTGGLSGGRVLARGLVLSASRYASGERTQWGQKFELRDLVLDVELPGREPYEVSVTPLIPRICEGRPGAAFDLAVHPRRPNDILILGPAGSSGWLAAAPTVSSTTPGAGGGRFVIAAFFAVFPTLFALGVVLGARKASDHHSAAPPSVAHRPSTSCDLAARCCKTLGSASCTQFATMTEATCVHALDTERAAAKKAHKVCP